MRVDPFLYLRERLAIGGRCVFMPNGGNLGDNLIASATIQGFSRAKIPWVFFRDQRGSIGPLDILVYGGGGSLVSLYSGGIECVARLLQFNLPVVVLPQTVNGNPEFWRSIRNVTVFCRDAISIEYLSQFDQIQVLPSDDLAIGLDLDVDPFSTAKALRVLMADVAHDRVLRAYRGDAERAVAGRDDGFDISACAFPPMTTVESVHGNSCSFLASLAMFGEIWTDRLHVGIAGGLLGIRTHLSDNSYGKNRAVFEFSLKSRFNSIRFEDA